LLEVADPAYIPIIVLPIDGEHDKSEFTELKTNIPP
jgi:hypothetical protein